MSDIVLKIGKSLYSGWIKVNVDRSIDTLCGTFKLEVSDKWRHDMQRREIRPGDACQLLIDNQPVITGWIDDANPSYSADDHIISVSGRDATEDLVDCSGGTNGTEWKGQNLAGIVSRACKPFNIPVLVETDLGEIFASETVQDGETVFELIDRLCRQRGVMAMSDGLGNLILTKASDQASGGRLVYGDNILSGSKSWSWRDRHSSYQIKGQQRSTFFVTPEQAASPSATVYDKSITRFRPLILNAETQGDDGRLQKRALVEKNSRAGKALQAQYRVQGWLTDGDKGEIWRPNRMVDVDDPYLGIQKSLLISTVRFSKNEAGSFSEITVTDPAAYDLIDFPEEEDGGSF